MIFGIQQMMSHRGSTLGTTLFSVYINNIALALGDSLVHTYADDTIIFQSMPDCSVLSADHFTSTEQNFAGLAGSEYRQN